MSAKVFLHRRAAKEFQKLPKKVRIVATNALEVLKVQPFSGLPLKGELEGKRKFRVGEWRIIYEFFRKEGAVVVYKIESRQKVYK